MAAAVLSHELSQHIVQQVNQIISKNISICNREGVILASSFDDKVGSILDESVGIQGDAPKVVRSGKELSVITPLFFQGNHAANLVIYNDEAWQDHVKLVKSLAELLGERYMEIQEPPAESKDRIIYRLLHTDEPDQLLEIKAEAERAGFDLDRPRIAMIVRLTNFWQTFFKNEEGAESREANIIRFRNKIEQALTGFFTSSPDNIITYLGDDAYVILKDISTTAEDKFIGLFQKNFSTITSQIKNSTINEVTVGVGSFHSDVVGLRDSYREAQLALELGERMWGADRVYHINNLGIPGLIAESSPEKKTDFADRLLGPLLPHKELVRTMEEFFKYNLNLTNTADALKIHRNTLIYRLDKITSIINLDPRFFQEAVQIYLALLIKRIMG
jgi:carbohydrate diacid regulator